MTIKIKAGSNVSSYAVMTALRDKVIFNNEFESVIYFLRNNLPFTKKVMVRKELVVITNTQ